jgi:hypothetical protein
MNDEVRRKFLTDYPEQDPNPTLQDILHDDEPPFIPRTEAENLVFAALPEDDLSTHPLGPHTNNPYFKNSYQELKDMLEGGSLSREQEGQVLSALDQHRRHHAYPHSVPGDASQR